jgi:hypothetical protein
MADYDDNMYPADGEWFATPDTTLRETSDEKRKLGQAKPLIQDVVKHLDERIAFLASIDSIPADLSIEPVDFQKLLEVNRGLRVILQSEREYIAALVDKY